MEHRRHGCSTLLNQFEDGELSFRSSPDYEAPNDANTDNVYEVTVRASDDDLTSTINVEVTVTNANESGVITGPTSVNYPENEPLSPSPPTPSLTLTATTSHGA